MKIWCKKVFFFAEEWKILTLDLTRIQPSLNWGKQNYALNRIRFCQKSKVLWKTSISPKIDLALCPAIAQCQLRMRCMTSYDFSPIWVDFPLQFASLPIATVWVKASGQIGRHQIPLPLTNTVWHHFGSPLSAPHEVAPVTWDKMCDDKGYTQAWMHPLRKPNNQCRMMQYSRYNTETNTVTSYLVGLYFVKFCTCEKCVPCGYVKSKRAYEL